MASPAVRTEMASAGLSVPLGDFNFVEPSSVAPARSFRLAPEDGNWIAWHPHGSSEEPANVKAIRDNKSSGSDLVVRDLANDRDRTFRNVTTYRPSDDGQRIAFVTSSKDGSKDGVHVWRVRSGAAAKPCADIWLRTGTHTDSVADLAGGIGVSSALAMAAFWTWASSV